MKRSWDIIRELLEKFENETISDFLEKVCEAPDETLDEIKQKKREEYRDLVFGHLLLLQDSELVTGIEAVDPRPAGKWFYKLKSPRLTMAGHDTLGALRSKTVWDAIKQKAEAASIPITLELIKAGIKALV